MATMSYFRSFMGNHFYIHSKLSYGLIAMIVASLAHYSITSALFKSADRNKNGRKTPPVIPHFLPFLGSIPWQYFWSPIKLFTSSYYATLTHPFRIRLFSKEFYIIQGQEHVVAHLAQTSTSNTIFNASFLRQACAMSEHAVQRFGSEDEETPKYFERKYLAAAPLYSWSSSVIHRYLAGRTAFQLSRRFEINLATRIGAHQALSSPEGVVLEDFMDFFVYDVTSALLDAMCGKSLVERDPGFPRAFGIFCDNLPTFMKRTPRFLAPQEYKAREEVIEAVMDWQTWASENFDAKTTALDEDGDDPLWGSKFFRERYTTFVHDMGFDPRDIASMELGFLFGASANVTANTYCCAIEVFKDKVLLEEVRKEVQSCKGEDQNGLRFDTSRLVQQPLLQAVFAESLRLRCHNMFIRKTTEAINILDWVIPKDQFVIAWSTPGQMNPKVWADANGMHPVDTFWPGRFMKYSSNNAPAEFSMAGKESSWLPFGSGANLCPGRQFAKIHCIVTLAMMVDSFDCDILAGPRHLKPDLGKFGMGVLGPSGKVGARIQRQGTKA
ncbi:cytochrome P450 [Karstenula rhodostoma CBS 690.94]|uniref:Cytochrome P450 n=1 Tax=Karstenula rhodostoma CBS 690.94 TaxID=1392251 RepID=A0A9P4UDQ3_9PLEO|nr:cytochrome P450 [Karstenula rhodostoma CBS 690.94]